MGWSIEVVTTLRVLMGYVVCTEVEEKLFLIIKTIYCRMEGHYDS